MLLRTITAVALLSALLGCASPTPHESSYNEGVIAFRAKDYATARMQWAKAVDDGDASAMNNLGYLLFQGLGGSNNRETETEILRDASKSLAKLLERLQSDRFGAAEELAKQ
jgi:TPR repeat protein